MDYSQVSFNKIMLSITPQGEGISFNKGEILQGLVQGVREDGLVMLFIKGKLIEAASEILVKSGQQLYLMVDEYRDGRTYLKVLTPSMMGNIEKANLSASLRDLGLTANQKNVQMARKLLDYNLPVTTSNLNNLTRGIKMLGGYSPRNLEIAAFAMSRDMAVSPASLTALAQITSSRSTEVARLFNDIWQMLNLANTTNTTMEAGKPPMTSTVISRSQDVGTIPFSAGLALEQAATEPSTRILPLNLQSAGEASNRGQTGIPPARIPGQDLMGINPSTSHIGAEPPVLTGTNEVRGLFSNLSTVFSPGLDRNGPEILNVLGRLLETMLLKSNLPAQENIARMADMVKNGPDLIKSLQMLADIIKDDKTEMPAPILRELASRLEGLEKEITGQRLFNIAARLPGENIINGYYFTFPVQVENELRLCQLKIHREAKKSLQSLDHIRFIVSLDTRNLGMVLFYIDWKRSRELELQGVVEHEAARQQLSGNMSKLTDKLQDLGYQVSFLGIKTASPADMINLRPELTEKPESVVRPFSIDVTV